MTDRSTTETKSIAKTRPGIGIRLLRAGSLYTALAAIILDKICRLGHAAPCQTEVMEQTSTITFSSLPRPGNDNKVWEQLSVAEALRQTSYHYRFYRTLLAGTSIDSAERADYVAGARQGITLIQQLWTLLGQERTTSSN